MTIVQKIGAWLLGVGIILGVGASVTAALLGPDAHDTPLLFVAIVFGVLPSIVGTIALLDGGK